MIGLSDIPLAVNAAFLDSSSSSAALAAAFALVLLTEGESFLGFSPVPGVLGVGIGAKNYPGG